MKALSILQPWAWAILHLGKDIENRTWRTNVRGRFLIHTGKGFDTDGYWHLRDTIDDCRGWPAIPDREQFERGGIVGSAVLRDCVMASESKWFFGPYGFVLQGIKRMVFLPYRGERGFFEVPCISIHKNPESENV